MSSSKPLILRKESARFPGLFVEKYTRRVFWDNLWNENPDLIESRGLVKAASGKVVIRPFTKIFNRGENGVDIDRDEEVLAVAKINGFMAGATFVECVGGHGQVVVSTTGSLDSDYVLMAEKYLLNNAVEKYITEAFQETKRPCTFLFEIVDPEDPHIIPEKTGAYLIGAREVGNTNPYFSTDSKESMLDTIAQEMEVMRPDWIKARFSDVVKAVKNCKHEGFCVYGWSSHTALKMKSPYYLALKAAARIKDITSLDKKRVDEEFYPLIDQLAAMGAEFNELEEQVRLKMIRDLLYVENLRKDAA